MKVSLHLAADERSRTNGMFFNKSHNRGTASDEAEVPAESLISGTESDHIVIPPRLGEDADEPEQRIDEIERDDRPRGEIELRCIPGNLRAHANRELRENVLFEAHSNRSYSEAGGFMSRSALNICLCLDRSGSMEGDALAYAKRACSMIVDMLSENDTLSLVTFAERGEVLLRMQMVEDRAEIKALIETIHIGNRTNLHEGLEVAIEQVMLGQSASSINRILLLTDGEPTAGTKDFQSIVSLVIDRKKNGLQLTALGFGPDYNEELVAALAKRTGGNYYYITRPNLLPEIFRREMDSMMKIIARDVKLSVNFHRGVTVRQVFSNEYRMTSNRTFESTLSDIERDSIVTSLWELDITPHPAGTYRLGTAEIDYEDSATKQRRIAKANIVIEFSRDSAKVQRGVNPLVQREAQLALAADSLDRTMMSMKTSTTAKSDALAGLERTQRLLIDHGQIRQADELGEALEEIKKGASVEKTLVGTIVQLSRGKRA